MSNFDGVEITDAGEGLLSGVLAGQTITFTRLVIGDGTMPPTQTPQTMTAVVSPRLSASITSVRSDAANGTATVFARFSNSEISSPIEWSEIGLYAKGPSGQEVLYSYGYDSSPDTIPAAGPTAVEDVLSMVTYVGSDTNVTATFDPSFVPQIASITDEEIDSIVSQESVDPTTGKDTDYLDRPGLSYFMSLIPGVISQNVPMMTPEEVESVWDSTQPAEGGQVA